MTAGYGDCNLKDVKLTLCCSFCGKSQRDVQMMLVSDWSEQICSACVAAAWAKINTKRVPWAVRNAVRNTFVGVFLAQELHDLENAVGIVDNPRQCEAVPLEKTSGSLPSCHFVYYRGSEGALVPHKDGWRALGGPHEDSCYLTFKDLHERGIAASKGTLFNLVRHRGFPKGAKERWGQSRYWLAAEVETWLETHSVKTHQRKIPAPAPRRKMRKAERDSEARAIAEAAYELGLIQPGEIL